ncbi:MAG: hypothetical protein QOF96_585 [Actinomycetota bacterium]|nr:hypothetical protein [Actinomycetota bacterium]
MVPRRPCGHFVPGPPRHDLRGLLHDLGASEIAFHSTTKGDNAELNWLKMLRDFLPQRYQVESAFVVDVNDSVSEQLDVVIYDSQYSPLLFKHEGGLYIPAESVYGVFEVKPELETPGTRPSVTRLEPPSTPAQRTTRAPPTGPFCSSPCGCSSGCSGSGPSGYRHRTVGRSSLGVTARVPNGKPAKTARKLSRRGP